MNTEKQKLENVLASEELKIFNTAIGTGTLDNYKEEDLKYIWDKYYHSDKKHKRNEYGTGLGLSIVKNILQNHKCKYGVSSSSKGSTFYFEIDKS